VTGKSVAEKLLIRPGASIWASPTERLGLLEPLPDGVTPAAGPASAVAAIVFADGASALRAILDANRSDLARPAVFWVAYPKGNRADINRDTLWPILTDYGMRPIGQVAVDDVWSALRFRPLAEGEAPFTGR
jgi:hypothetical protein